MTAKQGFISRNLVTIVMVPFLIGVHYGWLKLQENDVLVSEEERRNLPFSATLEKLGLLQITKKKTEN